jgi:hypothetical protein
MSLTNYLPHFHAQTYASKRNEIEHLPFFQQAGRFVGLSYIEEAKKIQHLRSEKECSIFSLFPDIELKEKSNLKNYNNEVQAIHQLRVKLAADELSSRDETGTGHPSPDKKETSDELGIFAGAYRAGAAQIGHSG